MSAIYNKIQQAAHQHEQLLRGLEEIDNAGARLMQQTRYVDNLEVQMSMTAKLAERLRSKALIKLKEHEKYRDSTFRRFAHRASGNMDKFTEKAAKEEKEYLREIKRQKKADDDVACLKQLCDEAEERRKEISAEVQRYESLQTELNALYNSIFAGPTPEFPEEDVKENARDATFAQVKSAVERLKHQKHILSLLNQTEKALTTARSTLDYAYGASHYDMFVGGSLSSMQKLDHLDSAASTIRQVRRLQAELKQAASSVHSLSQVDIPEGSFTMDVLFDNIFTDMRMHEEIKHSILQVERARIQCDALIRQQRDVEKSIMQEINQAHRQHFDACQELEAVRKQIFKSVLSDLPPTATPESATVPETPGVSDAPPPEYAPPEGPPPGYSD